MSQGSFSDTMILWTLFKEYMSGTQKIDLVSKGLVQGFFVKFDKILKWAFFARLCP